MSRLLKSQEHLMRYLGVVILLGFISLGAIGGCNNDGDELSQVIQALTENDFSNDPGLSADPEKHLIVMILEHPDSEKPENDIGEVGNDIIPYTYISTLNHTLCWEDDDADAEHFMVIEDSEGNEILRLDVGDCVTEVIEAGDYVMIINHDGRIEKTHPIFIRPEPNGDLGAKKEETIPEGILERAGKFLSKILDKLDISITQTTNAQSVADNVRTLLSTGSCVDCDLSKANLIGRDLSGVDLSGAILKEAKLYQAILTGVIVSQSTDLSLATAPNGGKFPPNSFPDSSGMIDTVIDFPNSNEHQITFTNNCQEPVWIGVIFSSAPALPFLPANNNRTPPLWGPNNMPSWEIPPDGGD